MRLSFQQSLIFALAVMAPVVIACKGAGLQTMAPPTAVSALAAPTQASAASRVFAIPELLEEILLQLASDTLLPTSNLRNADLQWYPMPADQLALSLFTAQRVSKGFLNTIRGSVKLKPLMWRAPVEEVEEDNLPLRNHRPLECLLGRMGRGFFSREPCLISEQGSECVRVGAREDSDAFDGKFEDTLEAALRWGWLNPEASWRDIPICHTKSEKNIILQLATSTISYPDIGTAVMKWDLSPDTTLGRVYELFRRFFKLVDQQRVIKVEYDRQFAEGARDAMRAGLETEACAYGLLTTLDPYHLTYLN
ncbi:uncharacterized protein MYCFIDRAFT_192597 [Pseudocercospora fijiensis CIRAD86]|uniref:F-box domain-containing protein n=1 Tax=Pseudocercospora fijiensis (strain CIRAD86) TaxID=383855 RepID=N1QBA1_PSEFD|nr:uncharacterized protein MYCFIDRAFT_192597 [Pseudocercospora fijiensis CIRAD86]EME88422.1 hypothetical protein MYCFIDRAFT_192597 [Pseudocercospora fijiensis CIRAD86]